MDTGTLTYTYVHIALIQVVITGYLPIYSYPKLIFKNIPFLTLGEIFLNISVSPFCSLISYIRSALKKYVF